MFNLRKPAYIKTILNKKLSLQSPMSTEAFGNKKRFKILRIGEITYAKKSWEKLSESADILDMPIRSDYGRKEFIKDLETNPEFQDIDIITRDLETKRYVGLFDKELVSKFPKSVKLICIRAAGYDQVDTSALIPNKIQLANTPGLVSKATADTNVFLIISALRNFQWSHHNLLNGNWEKCGGSLGAGTPVGRDIEDKVVGVLGNGKIGRCVIERLRPFGVTKFLYHNRNKLDPELEAGAEYVSFDDLLRLSDVISVNVPLNRSTHHLINNESISKMKDGVVIVNTARGPVIDEKALIKHLKSGKVFSAGLDVFENEPFGVDQELISLPNVVSLPHMGTHTMETIASMEEFVVKNIRSFIETGKAKTLVSEQRDLQF